MKTGMDIFNNVMDWCEPSALITYDFISHLKAYYKRNKRYFVNMICNKIGNVSNNPTIENTTAEGHQQVFNVAYIRGVMKDLKNRNTGEHYMVLLIAYSE